jgi:hypothetical protein
MQKYAVGDNAGRRPTRIAGLRKSFSAMQA